MGLYAFYTKKAAFWKNMSQYGGRRPQRPSLNPPLFKNGLRTALRTIFWPKCKITGFCIYNHDLFPGMIPSDPHRSASDACLDPDTNFRLAHQRSHCSCFTKRLLHGDTKSKPLSNYLTMAYFYSNYRKIVLKPANEIRFLLRQIKVGL